MGRSYLPSSTRRAFSLIEMAIAFLIVSVVALKSFQALSRNQAILSQSESDQSLQTTAQNVQSRLKADIEQSVGLFPSCDDNAAPSFVSGSCDDLEVRGGITPLPGLSKSEVDALNDFLPTVDLTANPATLSGDSDALRIVAFDFSGSFNCRLNPRHTSSANPSTTAGVGAGAQRFWAHPQCSALLTTGRLYVITEEIDSVTYSNVFQVTNLTTQTLGDSTTEIQVDHTSATSPYNQPGGFGLAGYSSEARIYPIKLIEWAVDDTNGGLYRREFVPTALNLSGEGNWTLVDPTVEDVQFSYTTRTMTGGELHIRTMTWDADEDNNGIEDLIGVNPQIVFKSSVADRNNATGYDNPLSTSVEADAYPREEAQFLSVVRNR